MTSHELAKGLLELPNVPVVAEENGYEADREEVELAYFDGDQVILVYHPDFPRTPGLIFKPDGIVPESYKCPVCDFVGVRTDDESAFAIVHHHVHLSHGAAACNALESRKDKTLVITNPDWET